LSPAVFVERDRPELEAGRAATPPDPDHDQRSKALVSGIDDARGDAAEPVEAKPGGSISEYGRPTAETMRVGCGHDIEPQLGQLVQERDIGWIRVVRVLHPSMDQCDEGRCPAHAQRRQRRATPCRGGRLDPFPAPARLGESVVRARPETDLDTCRALPDVNGRRTALLDGAPQSDGTYSTDGRACGALSVDPEVVDVVIREPNHRNFERLEVRKCRLGTREIHPQAGLRGRHASCRQNRTFQIEKARIDVLDERPERFRPFNRFVRERCRRG